MVLNSHKFLLGHLRQGSCFRMQSITGLPFLTRTSVFNVFLESILASLLPVGSLRSRLDQQRPGANACKEQHPAYPVGTGMSYNAHAPHPFTGHLSFKYGHCQAAPSPMDKQRSLLVKRLTSQSLPRTLRVLSTGKGRNFHGMARTGFINQQEDSGARAAQA